MLKNREFMIENLFQMVYHISKQSKNIHSRKFFIQSIMKLTSNSLQKKKKIKKTELNQLINQTRQKFEKIPSLLVLTSLRIIIKI